jgi:hypothetical protein
VERVQSPHVRCVFGSGLLKMAFGIRARKSNQDAQDFGVVAWREIECRLGVSARTARRAFAECGKNPSANAPTSAVD